jgi:Na+-transporting NADH:ubiquinone oxidoreductase subunit C
MNTTSNGYVLGFAVTVCVVASAGLAVTATSLRDRQQVAAEFDRQKNVMVAAGLIADGDPRPMKELQQLYRDRVTEQVLDTETGKVLADRALADVAKMNKQAAEEADAAKKSASAQSLTAEQETAAKDKVKKAAARYRVVAVAKGDDGRTVYVLPVSGKGLWSTLYGYLALADDANTVRGITFYQHGETPGLGGEVDNPQWKELWKGKTVRDGDKLVGITVKKGRVDPSIPAEKAHYVDGLSGATITSNGVTKFVKADLQAFESYLAQVKKQ